MKIAILIDGGFYRKRAKYLYGKKTAKERANELNAYCLAHLKGSPDFEGEKTLY